MPETSFMIKHNGAPVKGRSTASGCWRQLVQQEFFIRVISAILLLSIYHPLWAQQVNEAAGEISVEHIQAIISGLDTEDESIDANIRSELLETYNAALDQLQARDEQTEEYEQFKSVAETGVSQLEKLNTEISKRREAATDFDIAVATASQDDIESQLIIEQSTLLELRNRLSGLRDKLTEMKVRPQIVRQQTIDARKALEETRRTLSTLTASVEQDRLAAARQALLLAREQYRIAEIARLNQEILSHDLQTQLLEKNIELLETKTKVAGAKVAELNKLLQEVRRTEAERVEKEAVRVEQEVSDRHAVLQRVAEQNAEYSRELASLITYQNETNNQLAAMRTQAERIVADAAIARSRLESAQVSEALGQVLREQRQRLPNIKNYRRDAKEREKIIAEITAGQFQAEQRLGALDDLENVVSEAIEREVESEVPVSDRERIEKDLRKLLTTQKKTLNKLSETYTDNLRILADLDFEHKQLVDESVDYAQFLDERLLWIRSSPPLNIDTLKDLPDAFAWQVSPNNWQTLVSAIISDFFSAPIIYVLAVIVLVIVVQYRRAFLKSLLELADKVKRIYSDQFSYTIAALLLTLLLALPFPVITGFFSWRLLHDHPTDPFVQSVGGALALTAVSLLVLRFLTYFCRKGGVAQAHFHWRGSTLKLLRTNLPWLTIIFVIAILLAFIDWNRPGFDLQSLTRFAFIGVTIALAVFSKRVFEPESGVLASVIARHPNGWLSRLRLLWYPAIILVPLLLAVLAGLGYLATAAELYGRVESTVWLILAAVIIHNLVERFLIVAQRRLAIKKARERREVAGGEPSPTESSAEGDRVLLDTAELDISTINAQTRHLMKTILGWTVVIGIWWIWSSVLPALGVLDKLTLWQSVTMVDGKSVSTSITLTTLVWALAIGLIVAAAARNLPGVLEIVVLQRLPIGFGSRYAITKISQYLIIAVGIVVIFSTIGVAWSHLQWLVAALGVGLGFGLQEIFANFMSGLIMLFERPVRIGDTVTIGDLSGTVSRIRMRATTITDWDNKEIIVPNKMFITDRLINWTLSDPITRVIIPVGIAYGSDTNLAYRVICETAEQNPIILKEPQYQVFFLGFGESSLNFELRVFVKDLCDRLRVQHELHMAINKAFADNDIEIPFPQRDLHVRSWLGSPDFGPEAPEPPAS